MNPHLRALHDFHLSPLRNRWINHADIKVYVRKGVRRLPGTTGYQMTIDVANIEVPMKGKGLFTEWLTMVELEAKHLEYDAVFVESILNERLYNFLKRRGYQDMPESIPPSVYLMTNGV